MRYRKKPIIVEAMQYDGTAESDSAIIDWTRDSDTPALMARAVTRFDDGSTLVDDAPQLVIKTPEGVMLWVEPGDFVIRDVQGEHCPCKPDIFAATYDPIDD